MSEPEHNPVDDVLAKMFHNGAVHPEMTPELAEQLRWVRDLIAGRNPGGTPGAIIIVEDEALKVGRTYQPPSAHEMAEMLRAAASPPPGLVAMADQAWKASRDARAEAPQAAQELRCVSPPMGCGQPLGKALSVAFRDQRSRDEYGITGMCQGCQDEMFKPAPDELLAMAGDTVNYDRCGTCGEWRPLEFVDVGVGVISGFDCCNAEEWARLPRCIKTENCGLRADHRYSCSPPPFDTQHELARLTAWMVEQGYIETDDEEK